MRYIQALKDISNNVDYWGGKAVALKKIYSYSIPVPNGIVIHSKWYENYLSLLNKRSELNEFKNILKNVLSESLKQQNLSGKLIFRSSANIEGCTEACCCGIFESIACDDEEGYVDSVIRVWESALDFSTQKYLSSIIDVSKIKMSVLIQAVYRGEFCGVIQTYDIVNDMPQIIIELCKWRLEAVVDGKENSQIIIMNYNGKILDEPHPKMLDDNIVKSLYNLACKIESIIGGAVEIEYVIAKNTVYILQVREMKG